MHRLTHEPTPTLHRPPDALLFLTTVSALDGTIFLLAAQGAFSHVGGAVAAGLTVVAGGGAWTTAWAQYGGRRLTRTDLRRLTHQGALGALATILAVLAGSHYGTHATLTLLPIAAGIALLLLGLEVGGLRLPRARGIAPVPLLLATSMIAEVLLHWTP